MVASAYIRGHPANYNQTKGLWQFLDGTPCPGWGGAEPPCPRCGVKAEPNGPDPCLGRISGASSACCGHGVEPPYVVFADGEDA